MRPGLAGACVGIWLGSSWDLSQLKTGGSYRCNGFDTPNPLESYQDLIATQGAGA
jgi:hypothetical protein